MTQSKKALLEEKLRAALAPTHLEVTDESHRHNVPKGAQTHFKIVVASPRFEGQGLIARHRAIYAVLDEEIKGKKVHALALHAFTPAEWEAQGIAHASPDCHGGSKHG